MPGNPASHNPAPDNTAHRRVVGIDVGGTFTDIAVLEDGKLTVHKLPSTPADPSQGILQGVFEGLFLGSGLFRCQAIRIDGLVDGFVDVFARR